MRRLLLIFLALAGSVSASDSAPAYPLWDGHESVADYAKRVNLPPSKTLDLGNGVKLDLGLIPAVKFMMGTPEPLPTLCPFHIILHRKGEIAAAQIQLRCT